MKNLLYFLAFAGSIVATSTTACTPAPPNELFAHAEFVLLGTATGSEETGSLELPVTYKVVKVLSGKPSGAHKAVSPCHLPIQKGERVVVGSVEGKQYLFPADWYDEAVRVGR